MLGAAVANDARWDFIESLRTSPFFCRAGGCNGRPAVARFG